MVEKTTSHCPAKNEISLHLMKISLPGYHSGIFPKAKGFIVFADGHLLHYCTVESSGRRVSTSITPYLDS